MDLLVIAGEHSGDQHAASLLRDLEREHPGLSVAALGGANLRLAGAQLLFDLVEHSVVGFAEVVRHYGFFRQLFRAVIEWIAAYRPRVILLVDYPGFNLRLARALHDRGLSRSAGGEVRLAYYISPQVWAWKSHRRFAMARYLDSLAVIFPFERKTFADTSLEAVFVGHPFLREDFQLPVQYDPDGPVLLLPGSRRKAVQRIVPVLIEGFARVAQERPHLRSCILFPDTVVRLEIEAVLDHHAWLRPRIDLIPVSEGSRGRAVLGSSGTMSLNCALAGIPGAIVYKTQALTYWLARGVVRIPYIGIANLLLDRPLYPEFIQARARPDLLARRLDEVLDQPAARREAQTGAAELRNLLGTRKDEEGWRWLERQLELAMRD